MSTPLDRLALAATAFGAGVVAGLFLAREPGDQARARVIAQARDAAETARLQARDFAEPLADAARDRARDLAERHVPLADDFDVVDGRDLLDDLNAGRD